jgi:tRNA(fMet)-specific endonuclease VapC
VRILLDSTFLIDHLRSSPDAARRLARLFADGDDVLVDPVAICEVRFGVRDAHIPAFLDLLEPLEVVAADREAALMAGRWRMRARAAGHHLGLPDALIAATAHAVGAAVLTRNVRDFELTPVRIETY